MLLPIFRVLVDANVLFPLALCDILLRAADADLFQLYWSERILDELEGSLVRELECTEQGARRRVAAMREHFPASMVSRYEHLIPAMLNEPGDRHVAAAAVAAGAQVIRGSCSATALTPKPRPAHRRQAASAPSVRSARSPRRKAW